MAEDSMMIVVFQISSKKNCLQALLQLLSMSLPLIEGIQSMFDTDTDNEDEPILCSKRQFPVIETRRYPKDPVHVLFESFNNRNPRQVITWIIYGHDSLDKKEIDPKHASSFEGEYEKQQFNDLKPGEQDNVVQMLRGWRGFHSWRLFDSKDTHLWCRGSSQILIWKRCECPNYLISYQRKSSDTHWVIGAENKVLFSQEVCSEDAARMQPVKQDSFPDLRNKEAETIGELQADYERMRLKNEELRLEKEGHNTICTWLIRPKYQGNHPDHVDQDVFGHYRRREFQDLTAKEQQHLVDVTRQIAEPIWIGTDNILDQAGAIEWAAWQLKRHPGLELDNKGNSPWYITGHDLVPKGETVRYPYRSILHFLRPEDDLKWDLSFESSIWQQSGRSNYMFSYKRSPLDCRKETLWILSSETFGIIQRNRTCSRQESRGNIKCE